MEATATVFVAGDAHDIRECLDVVAITGPYTVRRFSSIHDALEHCEPEMPGCFVLDQTIRGASGLHLYEQLRAKGCQQPFIYLLRDANVSAAVEAMHHGALDCIERPLGPERLLSCVRKAIGTDADSRRRQADRAVVLARVELLTPREKQILELVAAGEITKAIARQLQISPKTVEVHRSNIMKKMQVESAAGLLHQVAKYALFPFSTEAIPTFSSGAPVSLGPGAAPGGTLVIPVSK